VIATLLSVLFATDTGGFWMPRKASTVAGNIDLVFDWVLWASVIFFVGIVAAMVYFAIAYRKKSPDQKTHPISGSTRLELWWTIIPTIGLFVLFGFGFYYWIGLSIPPGDSFEIRANAKRWAWSFDYPRHNLTNVPELVVPHSRNIKLVMMSSDVLHSFYVPEFRVKRDVLPNRYTVVWFNATKEGLNRLQTVKKAELKLDAVVTKMAFARDVRAAQQLIAAGRILINGKAVRSASYQVKLNDRIEVAVDQELIKALSKIRSDADKRAKEAEAKGEANEADKIAKEGRQKFLKKAPKWLLQVLNAMKAARDAEDAIKQAEGAIKLGADVLTNKKLTAARKQKAIEEAKKAKVELPKLRKAYARRYKLPEWLYANRSGLVGMWGFVSDSFNLFCTEYCGKEHSRMITRVRVVSDELFDYWLKQYTKAVLKGATGKQLYELYGCNSCHSIDGSSNTGPTFLGLYGKKEVVTDKKDNSTKTIHLVDTDKKKAFREYIRESIYKPQAKIVKGYESQLMPTFQGQVSDEHLEKLIDFIKYLKPKKK